MDPQRRRQLAHRIHLGLMRELGQGIDIKQMLNSALYARDVLLVCQAHADTELPLLGEQFRQAAAEPPTRHADWRRDSCGFDEFAEALAKSRQPTRRWLTPSTWFAR